ncbi:PKD domain-containing protein [Paracrocinitomix mangrovi]|uniref:PKD domain-containing protein n=1 Tax=Paracrocinitomix mangrovi TaxID=2862509 RepID=UPI001EDA679C|nr:PKD domain-containing protein [Paracrocinitomix mangrovi]UKN00914.1 PKD domain-containing protein [Paracrocinitomix mangrovi]
MMKHLLLGVMATLSAAFSWSQTVVYSEDFTSGATWALNTVTGAEGSNPNVWYISCQEDGQTAGSCGTACVITDNSLHVGADALAGGDLGAAYFETGAGITNTDRRAESGNISTVGFTNLTLSFDMIGNGGNANDYCELMYSTDGGGTWTSLATPLTSLCCGGIACDGFTQGLWQNNTYALPAACENIANLRIGFVWKNLDDGIATDPSFAVDDIQITTPATGAPAADFTASSVSICAGNCIDFTDASTLGTNPTWSWTFNGSTTANSTSQNPTAICYPAPGSYQVSLTVTDDNGTDTETKVSYITVTASANAGSNVAQNLCNNTTLDLNTVLSGQDAGGTWTETSGTPSGQFTAGTGVLDGNGLTAGNVYTFEYTVTGTSPCPDATATVTITMTSCTGTPPTADFSTTNTTICAGDCIDFSDLSTVGTNPTWSWTFTGAQTTSSTSQNPTGICYINPGTYDVSLTVTDDGGSDTQTMTTYITVNPSPSVTASASPATTICTGEQVTLTGSGAQTYTWDNGVTDGTAFTPTATTTYTVTGTDANGCTRDAVITITVEACDTLTAGWSVSSNTICSGDCITFTNETTGTVSYYEWDFGGGGIPNTSNSSNPTVCFPGVGNYTVELTAIGGGDTSVFTDVITVLGSPSITAQLDTVIDLGGTAGLYSYGFGQGTYHWEPSDVVLCDTCSSTEANPILDTDFIVTFTDTNGCSVTDTVLVLVNFIEAINVPSAFSPNGDGTNDVLYVKGYGIERMTLTIYNRYGQKIFECDNQGIGWDGTFLGREENSGVFAWVLEYKLFNGTTGVLKGNTTLIR